MLNDKARPVYLNIFAIKFPITAIASISHRISGVLLFLGLVPIILLWHTSLQSEAGFDYTRQLLNIFLIRLFLWTYACTLFYHLLTGVKHIFMDLGLGEDIITASIISWGLIIIAILFSVLLGYIIFI